MMLKLPKEDDEELNAGIERDNELNSDDETP